jgi:hypothetical protein
VTNDPTAGMAADAAEAPSSAAPFKALTKNHTLISM